VIVIGHSLGGALVLLDGLYFRLNLPGSMTVKVVSNGMPHIWNQHFAYFMDKRLSGQVVHINNHWQENPIPVVPLIAMGFHHPSGQILIADMGLWDVCPGVCLLVFARDRLNTIARH
jgi:Lipase (class 3)